MNKHQSSDDTQSFGIKIPKNIGFLALVALMSGGGSGVKDMLKEYVFHTSDSAAQVKITQLETEMKALEIKVDSLTGAVDTLVVLQQRPKASITETNFNRVALGHPGHNVDNNQ